MAKRNLNSSFRFGGCYECRICGKKTRETGHGESGCEMRRNCYYMTAEENSVADGCMEPEEFTERWKTFAWSDARPMLTQLSTGKTVALIERITEVYAVPMNHVQFKDGHTGLLKDDEVKPVEKVTQ